MTRDLTTGLSNALDEKVFYPIFIYKAEFDSGDLNLWTGYGDLIWNSEVYTGSGDLLKISSITETQDLVANNATYTLSGVPDSLISLALSEDYSGRTITSWMSALNSSGVLIADPYQIFKGKMDVIEIKDEPSNSEITVVAESDLVGLRDANLSYYTPESQKALYPDDKGLDLMPISQDVELTWGAGRTD